MEISMILLNQEYHHHAEAKPSEWLVKTMTHYQCIATETEAISIFYSNSIVMVIGKLVSQI